MYYVVKTKALISCEITTQLICTFVVAYERSRFSYDAGKCNIPFYLFFNDPSFDSKQSKNC